jgi:hypothetical protein
LRERLAGRLADRQRRVTRLGARRVGARLRSRQLAQSPGRAGADYLALPAGTYDLKITTPGGATTLIDPLPVTLNDGDILSAFAIGDGTNQPTAVFALPAGKPGFILPDKYMLFLPFVARSE